MAVPTIRRLLALRSEAHGRKSLSNRTGPQNGLKSMAVCTAGLLLLLHSDTNGREGF